MQRPRSGGALELIVDAHAEGTINSAFMTLTPPPPMKKLFATMTRVGEECSAQPC